MKLNINRSIFLKVLVFIIVSEFIVISAVSYSTYRLGKEAIKQHMEKVLVLEGKLSLEEYLKNRGKAKNINIILKNLTKKMGGVIRI